MDIHLIPRRTTRDQTSVALFGPTVPSDRGEPPFKPGETRVAQSWSFEQESG